MTSRAWDRAGRGYACWLIPFLSLAGTADAVEGADAGAELVSLEVRDGSEGRDREEQQAAAEAGVAAPGGEEGRQRFERPAPLGRTAAAAAARVDLNRATVEELCTLPGIGPKRAAAIIEHRRRRPYQRVSQLLLVRGIGPKMLARLRPYVFVSRLPPRAAVPPAAVEGSRAGAAGPVAREAPGPGS